jgi:Mrp family chromosome partitioning ATPase
MLHRALQQFLADVYWGDLDVLLLDLPPGTGDIAISVAQLVPNAEILVVTTPQQAAAEVAERAGTIALQTRQRIAGVVENMSWMPCPHCDERVEVFGSGGGETVADALTKRHRREGAAARPDPDRPAAARGQRRRHAGGAVRPRLGRVHRAAGYRGQADGAFPGPGRDVAERLTSRSVNSRYPIVDSGRHTPRDTLN